MSSILKDRFVDRAVFWIWPMLVAWSTSESSMERPTGFVDTRAKSFYPPITENTLYSSVIRGSLLFLWVNCICLMIEGSIDMLGFLRFISSLYLVLSLLQSLCPTYFGPFNSRVSYIILFPRRPIYSWPSMYSAFLAALPGFRWLSALKVFELVPSTWSFISWFIYTDSRWLYKTTFLSPLTYLPIWRFLGELFAWPAW